MNCGRHEAFGSPCARARTGGGSPMSRPSGSRHRVQASRSRGNQAAQGALLSGTPRRRVRAQDGGSSVCLPRGPGPEKLPLPRRRNRRSWSRSSPTTRSLESRPSPRRHRICRQCQAAMRASRGIMSTNAMARSACWPGSIRLTGKVHALVRERHRSCEFIEFFSWGCRLSGQHRDQADPRQSFRTHFEGNPSLARHPAARPLRLYSSRPSTAPGSNLIEGFFLSLPAPSCAISE